MITPDYYQQYKYLHKSYNINMLLVGIGLIINSCIVVLITAVEEYKVVKVILSLDPLSTQLLK